MAVAVRDQGATGVRAPSAGDRLDSWKEIAAYLRRGVRTVQRWERELRLPVHRYGHDQAGSVYALREELDAWLAGQRPPTFQLEAYENYRRGRRFYSHYSRRDVEFAAQLFTKAIELDPAFALAHAGLADCYSYLFLNARRTGELRRDADIASLRAVELDPRSAQVQASRGLALSLDLVRTADAERAFETAIRLDPDLYEARYFYARQCFQRGLLERALQHYEEALRIRPEDYQTPLLMAQIYDDLGHSAGARATRLRGIENAERALAANPDDVRALYMAANGLAATGERTRSRVWLERALEMRPDEPMLLYNAGCIFTLLEEYERALDTLEAAARSGLTDKGWYLNDSNLDPLRARPRFQAILDALP